MKPRTRKILWTVPLVVLLAICVIVGIQSQSWERQAKAYAELAGKLEAILTVGRQPDISSLLGEPTFPDSRLSVDASARAAKVTREYQLGMYQAHFRYLRRMARDLEDHASTAESALRPAISGLPEPPFTFRVKTVTLDGEPVETLVAGYAFLLLLFLGPRYP